MITRQLPIFLKWVFRVVVCPIERKTELVCIDINISAAELSTKDTGAIPTEQAADDGHAQWV